MMNHRATRLREEKPRILILSNMYPSESSPSYGIFVKNIYTQFESANIDIVKCVIRGQRQTKLAKLLAYGVFIVESMLRLIFTRRIIYIHFVAHTSLPVLIVSFIRHFDIVAHVHGGDVMSQPGVSDIWMSIKSFIAKRTLSISKRVIVPSQYFSEFIQKEFQLESKSIFVSPSGGIDTKLFMPIEKQRKTITRLGYVGRLEPGKGIDTLLKAMKSLLQQGIKVQLTIVGTGRESERLSQYVINNQMSGTCCFVGAVAQHELPSYYQSFDYFIFPSELSESLGLVGLEAMSCGVPIVTNGQAGINDYFENRVNGFQFDSGSHISLSGVIASLPSVESNVYRQMAEQCRLTAMEFDSESVNKKLISEFSIISHNN